MHTIAIIFVLINCIAEAVYNVSIGKATKENPELKKRLTTLAGLTGLAATGLLFIVAFYTGGMELTEDWWWPVIITGILVGGILFAEFKAFSLEDVSLVSPISSTTPALVIITSMIILGEYPTWLGWSGIQLIAIGTYILNIQAYLRKRREVGRVRWIDYLAPFMMLFKSRGVRYAYLVVLFAIFSLNFEAMAVRRANVAFASACIVGVGSILNLAIGWKTEGRIGASEIKLLRQPLLIMITVCIFMMVFFANSAFRYDIVPYVGTLKRLQIPMSILLAWLVLHERTNFRERLFGGSLMAIGAGLIVLGGK